ncbi:MAG: SDR family NAD(P)-dependent oxidoreductase [Gammaproteobacteria bacterium]
MDLNLNGKSVLVIGATQGMGRGVARSVAREGARVAITARELVNYDGFRAGRPEEPLAPKPRVGEVAEELKALGATDTLALTADFTRTADIERSVAAIIERWGRLDAMVNTVGVCDIGTGALDAPDEWWDRAFQSVLMSHVRSARVVVPHMVRGGGGAIVSMSAMSIRHFIPRLAHYSAQKAALAHFTKNLAREYADRNIRANCILPGLIENEQYAVELRRDAAAAGLPVEAYFKQVNESWHRPTWSDRVGKPQEIGDVAAFLISDRASYINGAWINVDGGSDGA